MVNVEELEKHISPTPTNDGVADDGAASEEETINIGCGGELITRSQARL
jgi:hypothetical protein